MRLMMDIDFQNFFVGKKTQAQWEAEVNPLRQARSAARVLPKILPQASASLHGSAEILEDEKMLLKIEKFAHAAQKKFSHFVLLGMGGSALGAKSITSALGKNLTVLDTLDPDKIQEVSASLDLSKTLFLVVSKSGNTLETLALFSFFREKIEALALLVSEHFVLLTSAKGFLHEISQRENIPSFEIPSSVVGRFSVLSVVGLLPAYLLGVNIRQLLQGAKEMQKKFLSPKWEENLPYRLAVAHLLSKKSSVVLMPYASRLQAFTFWWAQLLAESTGKIALHAHVGFTPIPALGPADQHSLLQLLVQGPDDKLVIFLSVQKFSQEKKMVGFPGDTRFSFLKNQSLSHILHIEQKATAQSLLELGRPSIEISIPEISAHTLGELFFLFEATIAFLGELLHINVFDQPGVERGKILTREFLHP